MYCNYNQTENESNAQLIALNHPFRHDYRQLRDFFDGLKFACNSDARFFTFESRAEHSQYWGPHLKLSWNPGGSLDHFGNIYPAHDRWRDYMEEAAGVNFVGAYPSLDAGSWVIRTENPEFMVALRRLREDPADPFSENPYLSANSHLSLDAKSLTRHGKIVDLVSKFQAGGLLPVRTVRDDVVDEAPLPLDKKAFLLGNVREVTVTPRQVLIPLIGSDTRQAEKIVSDLTKLFDQGFPFVKAQKWLSKCLTKKAFDQIRRKYAHGVG